MPTYEGLYVQQRHSDRALCLFAFAATADDILSWATIERTLEVPGAAQRMKNESHVRTIRAFMDTAAENIIPTAVSVALRPGSYSVSFYEPTDGQLQSDSRICWARVEIQSSAKDCASGTIIDGQHRLLALQGHKEQPRILACAILGANDLERALHFVVINNKAKKVSTDLVKGIMAELSDGDRQKLKKRLTRVGITLGNYAVALEVLNSDSRSPFRNLVDWDINRTDTRIVKPQALESALRVILSSLLRSALEIDVDDAVAILIAMWRGVRDSWDCKDVSWSSDESKLIQKAGLVAVTEFLVERINLAVEDGFDTADVDQIEKYSKGVMSRIPSRFWLAEWSEKQLDTSAGRNLIRQSMAAIRTAVATGADDPLMDAVLVRR